MDSVPTLEQRAKLKAKAIADEARCDKMIADCGTVHHQACPRGRNFMAFRMVGESAEDRKKYRDNFDRIFKNSPGYGM
jgi:hypothetical protein